MILSINQLAIIFSVTVICILSYKIIQYTWQRSQTDDLVLLDMQILNILFSCSLIVKTFKQSVCIETKNDYTVVIAIAGLNCGVSHATELVKLLH